MGNTQIQLHPAADIFRDHLLSEVKDENRKLLEHNRLLMPSKRFLETIELHLHDGHVVSTTALNQLDDDLETHLCFSIDYDTQPLSNFSSGKVLMLGQTIGSFPGVRHIILGLRLNNAVLLRFSLSKHCAIEGVLDGICNEDYAQFTKKTLGSHDITQFLTSGTGLQHPKSIKFTPTMVIIDDMISFELKNTLKLLQPLPSHEVLKNHFDQYDDIQSLSLSSTEEQRLAVLHAIGYTDSKMEMLVDNCILKRDNSRLLQVEAMVGMIEIAHPSFHIKGSLKDGMLSEDFDGNPTIWRIVLTQNFCWRSSSITRRNVSSLEVSLSGIRLSLETIVTARADDGSLLAFTGTYRNGVHISASIFHIERVNFIKCTLAFPLSTVQSMLDLIGVKPLSQDMN